MIELNQELIRQNNNQSMFDRGSHIQEDAENDYRKFVEHYSNKEYNEKQLEILEKRKVQFRQLVTDTYNDYLNSSAKFVPITVAGPSNYPSEKMFKIQDRMANKIKTMEDKINKFYENTDKMLKNAYSKDEIISMYRNGYSEPISSVDPLAKEKLEAKLEYLKEKHQNYKDYNKKARANGKEQLPWYTLPYSLRDIKNVEDRLRQLEEKHNLKISDYYFDKGEVRFDKEDNRVKIYFDEIPDTNIRDELKHNAFKWSPKNKCWQRQLTKNAIFATKKLFPDIGGLEIKLVHDYTKDESLSI